MINYGFFNSDNDNRKYSADHFKSLFDGLTTDGILRNYGGSYSFQVNQDNNDGLNILTYTVDKGAAWFDNVLLINDSTYIVHVDGTDVAYAYGFKKRCVIAIFIDNENRTAGIDVVYGKLGLDYVTPPLEFKNKRYIPIAYVDLVNNSGSKWAYPEHITNVVGTTECPWAKNGVEKQIDLSPLFNRYSAEWSAFMTQHQLNTTPCEAAINDAIKDAQSDLAEWLTEQQEEFDTWVQTVNIPLTPQEVSDISADIATQRSALLPNSSVSDSPFDVGDHPDIVLTSRIIYKAFEQQKPFFEATINITLTDSQLFGEDITVDGPDSIHDVIRSTSSGTATYTARKPGAYTFTMDID